MEDFIVLFQLFIEDSLSEELFDAEVTLWYHKLMLDK